MTQQPRTAGFERLKQELALAIQEAKTLGPVGMIRAVGSKLAGPLSYAIIGAALGSDLIDAGLSFLLSSGDEAIDQLDLAGALVAFTDAKGTILLATSVALYVAAQGKEDDAKKGLYTALWLSVVSLLLDLAGPLLIGYGPAHDLHERAEKVAIMNEYIYENKMVLTIGAGVISLMCYQLRFIGKIPEILLRNLKNKEIH